MTTAVARAAAGAWLLFAPCAVFADSPVEPRSPAADLIQTKIDRTLAIIRDTSLQKTSALPALRRRIVEELEPLFAFREMTIRALGVHARQTTPAQIDALARSFKQLLERVYIDQLTANLIKTDNPYEVLGIDIAGNETRGNYAKIHSKVRIRKNADETELLMNYRMVERAGRWQVYDLEIEGVSLIENYRSQFNQVLTNESIDKLIESIQKNVSALEEEQPIKPKPAGGKTKAATDAKTR
ncbi:ABC transporter substrate-binding protein [bacterium]|nr:ABC transporter substrate-binding protein [bacterium]